MVRVATFYRFRPVPDPKAFAGLLCDHARSAHLRGTLIVAHEGVNGTLAGPAARIDAFLAVLATAGFDRLELKLSACSRMPFQHLKVKVKPEIVTLGDARGDPAQGVGTYVAPSDWNAVMRQPGMTVIDVRNEFEVALGSFPGALDPHTPRFSAFPAFADRVLDPARSPRIAMFCTGGIRCEKASALLRARGFAEVYHLRGGILAYLAQVPEACSLWQGDCFVFDDRQTLSHTHVVSGSGQS